MADPLIPQAAPAAAPTTPTAQVPVFNPDGQFGYMPADQLNQGAVAQGYRQASPEEAAQAQAEAKYGGAGQAAITALEHGADAATFGLSTVAERAMGVPAEDIEGRSLAHPVAGPLATGATLLGTSLLTGGATGAAGAATEGGSLLARAAKFTAPAIASKIGRAAEALVPEAVEGAGLAGRAVNAAARMAVGSGVEGALYGAGDIVDEAALGDPNLTAQSALAHVGLSAALGGGLGGLLGAGLESAQPIVSKALGAIDSAGNRTRQALEDAASRQGAKTTGLAEDEVRGLIHEGPRLTSPAAFKENVSTTTKELQSAYDSIQDVSKFVRENTEAEMHQATRGVPVERAQKAADEALTDILRAHEEIRAHPATLKQGAADTLDKLVEEFRGRIDEESSAGDIMVSLNKLKQDARKQLSIFSRDPSVEAAATNDLVKGLDRRLKTALEDEAVWGEAGARQAARNDAWTELLAAQGAERGKTTADTFRKMFMAETTDGWKVSEDKVHRWLSRPNSEKGLLATEVQNRYLSSAKGFVDQAGEVAKTANVPFDRAGVHDLLETSVKNVGGGVDFAQQVKKLNELTGENIKEGLGGRLSGGRGSLEKIVEGTALAHTMTLHPAVAAAYGAFKGWQTLGDVPRMVAVLAGLEKAQRKILSGIDTAASVLVSGSTKAANIGRGEAASGLARHFGGDQKSSDRLYAKRVDEIQSLAANAQTLQDRLVTQTGGIDSHAPQTAQQIQSATVRAVQFLNSKAPQHPPQGPLDAPWKPSNTEIAKFNRYYDAVARPTSILKQAAAGTLTPEAVEAVKTVYPDLFAQMQKAVLAKIADRSGNVPYQSRAMLSLLLGQPMDGTTQPATIKSIQAAYAKMTPAAPSQPRMNATGSLHSAERAMLPSQKSANR